MSIHVRTTLDSPWPDLKRFSGYGCRSKLDTSVNIPHTLNVSKYTSHQHTSGTHIYIHYVLSQIQYKITITLVSVSSPHPISGLHACVGCNCLSSPFSVAVGEGEDFVWT